MPKEIKTRSVSLPMLDHKSSTAEYTPMAEQILSGVAPYVHQTIKLDEVNLFPGCQGFVVYDDMKSSDFYARVEVDATHVTVMLDPYFAEPLIEKKEGSNVTLGVKEPKNKPKDSKLISGCIDKFLKEDMVIVHILNNRSAPKLCRMLITSAYSHRLEVQAKLPVFPDDE